MTGDISVELLTVPPSPSGSGDIDHELAAVLGPSTLEEDVAAYAAWESAPDAATTMPAPKETMTKEASDAIAIRKLGAAQRFVWLSFRLLQPAGWQLAICELLCSRRSARRLGFIVVDAQVTLSISSRQLTQGKETGPFGKYTVMRSTGAPRGLMVRYRGSSAGDVP